MRIGVMEDVLGSYNHDEEVRALHVNMGNDETDSNGRINRKESITMISLHRKVHRYRDDNERIMKDQEEILQSLNMLHKQVSKDSGTKKVASGIHVSTSRSHRKRDDHRNDRKSISMSRHHHSPKNSNRRTHAISRPGKAPSVSHVWSKRRRPEVDILQGEIGKIEPPTFNGEHRKGEEVQA
jgi:hypothetical protein